MLRASARRGSGAAWVLRSSSEPAPLVPFHPQLRLPNTLNVRFPRASGTALLAACPDVAASTGSACHDGGETASAVVLALGVGALDALGAVRLTLGRGTSAADIDRAAQALVQAWQQTAVAG